MVSNYINREILNLVKNAVRWQKNGSFAFAEGLVLCVGAKANVPFVRLAEIVFKKCAVGKNKNTEALAFVLAVCRFSCPVTFLCPVISFIFPMSSFRLAGNLFIPLTKSGLALQIRQLCLTKSGFIKYTSSESEFHILLPNLPPSLSDNKRLQTTTEFLQ